MQRLISMPPGHYYKKPQMNPEVEFRTPERPKDFGNPFFAGGTNEEAFPKVSPMPPLGTGRHLPQILQDDLLQKRNPFLGIDAIE